MLIVTGASGQLGRKIVEQLLRHTPSNSIGVSARHPEKIEEIGSLGVRVRQGDYEDAESLQHAWEGAERLLLVSSNAAATGGDTLKQHATAISVARSVGVKRIFYTSQVSASSASHFPPGKTHAATEQMLAESGIAWTAMRHGFYASSALSMNARAFGSGALLAPEDGKVAWTTHDDLAAADASLLVGTKVIDGPTQPLTGTEALDLTDLARLAGEILGKPVVRSFVTEQELEISARNAGVPEGSIAVMLGYYRAARAGEFESVDSTLAGIIGRSPQTMRSFMEENLK